MDRKAFRQKLDRECALLVEQSIAAKRKADEAKARYEAWLKPQRDFEAANKAWKATEDELHRRRDAAECELNADATAILKPFRDELCDLWQNEHHKYDHRDNPEDGKRLAALLAGRDKLDQLAVSGLDRNELQSAATKIRADIPPRNLVGYRVKDESTKTYETIGTDYAPLLIGAD